jgi:hypothetical protein
MRNVRASECMRESTMRARRPTEQRRVHWPSSRVRVVGLGGRLRRLTVEECDDGEPAVTLPPAIRVLLAIASCVAGVVGAIAVLAATRGANAWMSWIAFLVLLLGFLGLGVSRTDAAPLRPLRLALGIAAGISFALLLGLPLPPRGDEAVSAFVLMTVLLTSVAAAVLARRTPRMTGVLLVPLGIAACAVSWRLLGAALSRPRDSLSPAVTIAYVIAASMGAAWLSALWHGRDMLADILRRSRLH